MDALTVTLALVVAFIGGGILGWILRNRLAAARDRKHAQRTAELEAEVQTRAAAEQEATHDAIVLRVELDGAKERLQERKEDQALMQAGFKESAATILDERSKTFQERSQKSITELVKPLKDQLDHLRKELAEKGKEATEERIGLKEQVKLLRELNVQIGEEARNLTRALKGDAKARGNWGEVLLSRLLELSGLQEGRDFVREKSETDEDSKRLRPDVVVNLPEGRHLIIDAKVTLNAYETYCSAETDQERTVAMKSHIAAIRTHARGLSSKGYEHLGSLQTVDFVLMFMPIEAAFTEAMRHDSSFYDEAMEKKVLVVTPTNLLAVLRTVETVWRHERQKKNVMEIARQAGSLYDKFVGFIGSLEKIGVEINQASVAYEKAMGQLSTGKDNLVRKVQRLEELGAKTKQKMPEALLDMSEVEVEVAALEPPAPLLGVVPDEDEVTSG
jgi:DNA recombination protein RmuC